MVVAVGFVVSACSSPSRDFGNGQAGSAGSSAGSSGASGLAGNLARGGGDAGEPGTGGSVAGQGGGVDCGGIVCASAATCVMTPQAHCECAEGYTDPHQDGTLCEDIDECTSENGGCDPLVACVNTPGSFSCGTCPEGFTPQQGQCVDADECAVDNGGCDPLVSCTNVGGTFACGTCPFGYTGDGSAACQDIDECQTNNGGCDASVTCKNTPGGFTCGDCPPGHTGGGDSGCTDIDECKTNNGGCDALTTCTNSKGSFACGACPAGYAGTGASGCVNINECAVDNGGCHANAKCTDTPGSRTCACKTGYSGNGLTCSDTDECATNNGGCHANAKCTNTAGSRTCACKAGYTGDGLSCSCGLASPRCVNSLTQESCVNDTLTQKTCTGNQATCIDGTGCISCSGVRCGSTCCPTPPSNGTAVCTNANTCGVECKTGFHGCNGNNSTCYANNDAQHCGDSCAVCQVPNTTPSCNNGSCSYSCPAGLSLGCLRPDGSPVCSKWDFENTLPGQSTEGFAIDLSTTTGSDGVFARSTKRATSGSHSLAIGYTGTGSNEVVDVKIPLCPGGQSLDLTKRKLTMSVYPETKAGTAPYPSNRNGNYVIVRGQGGGYSGGCDGTTPPPDALWNWECNATDWPYDTIEIVLRFRVHDAWQGTFYIDNIKLQ
jgi:hypothetical protein